MNELEQLEATALAYQKAAQNHANGFWGMVVIGALLWYFWSIWAAAIPFALAGLAVALSVYCTIKATKAQRAHAFWKARLDAVR